VSDETSSIIEKYSKDNKVTWLLASDPGSKAMQEYGARGYPSAYLIDAAGKVSWAGHPATLKADQITELLKDVKTGGETKSGADAKDEKKSGEAKDSDEKSDG
jgi:peroxiredoxin